MRSVTPSRKRDRIRQWVLHRGSYRTISKGSVQHYAQDQVSENLSQQIHNEVLQPNSPVTTVVQDHAQGQLSEQVPQQEHITGLSRDSLTFSISKKPNFQDRVFQLLSQEDADVIRDSIGPEITDLQEIIQNAHKAAMLKLDECASKKWTIKVGDQKIMLEDTAKKVVRWLDQFKFAGDVAVNVDPLHAGLPWAIIRILLEAATSEHHQMEALLLGLEEISEMSQLLESYMSYLNELHDTKPLQNFENTLVKFHALILQFVASALRTYEKSTIFRGFAAFLKVDDISKYRDGFAKLASQAAANASICERNLTLQHQEQQFINQLPHMANATYTAAGDCRHRPCLNDTRVDELQDIFNWINEESDEYIYWLRGQAGTGKSTIAMTVAQRLEEKTVLLSSFFFLRGGGELARFGKVISTIIFQLARQNHSLRKLIYNALRHKPELADSASLETKFEELLLCPIKKLREEIGDSHTIVVVLDALDECDDDDQIQKFLICLGESQEIADLGIRLLITSRPEYHIRMELEYIRHMELTLQDVDRGSVDSDIQKFITYELTKIKIKRKLPESWPEYNVVRSLADNANGLFIHAATVCRYICNRGGALAETRLEQVVSSNKNAIHASLKPLDEIYSMVLKSSTSKLTPEEGEDFRFLLSSISLLYNSISAIALERLIFPCKSGNGRYVQGVLDSMHAVLTVPDKPTEPVQVQHLSFRDFLLSSDRSRSSDFYVDEKEGHNILFDRCLDLMSRYLRKNICNLTLGTMRDKISDATLRKHIPPELEYACKYWIKHANCGDAGIINGGKLRPFLLKYMLYWLEVIFLLDQWKNIEHLLNNLCVRLDEGMAGTLLEDARLRMKKFEKILNLFPLHLYTTVLLFSPYDSIIRKEFACEADKRIRLQTECLLDIKADGSHIDMYVKIVPEMSSIISCSKDGVIKVWESQSGEYQIRNMFEGPRSHVGGFDVSSDGSQVYLFPGEFVIVVMDTLRGKHLYDLENGKERVAFSSAASLVASASSSQDMIDVHDSRTGQLKFILEGHTEGVIAIVFSPNGSQLASASLDETVYIWDMLTGERLYTLRDRYAWNAPLIYSSNGSLLASITSKWRLWVWDVKCGKELLCRKIPTCFKRWKFNADSSWLRGTPERRDIFKHKDIPIPFRALRSSCFDDAGKNIESSYGWITWGLERILWVPFRHRHVMDHSGNRLVLVSHDKTMTIIRYLEDEGRVDGNFSAVATRERENLYSDEDCISEVSSHSSWASVASLETISSLEDHYTEWEGLWW